ncbi:hypothetical protein D3C87_2193180 [compost metagenome]
MRTWMPVFLVKVSVHAERNAFRASPPQLTTTSGLSADQLMPLRSANGTAASRPMAWMKVRRLI